MFSRYLLLAISAASFSFAGCSSSVDAPFNNIPTNPIIKTDDVYKDVDGNFIDNRLETFAVDGIGLDENEQPAANRLTGASLLAGTVPEGAVSTEITNALTSIRNAFDSYVGYSGDLSAITSTRNEVDVLESLIASQQETELQYAKTAMKSAIDSGEVRGYNNRSIIFESKDAADTEKFYYILDYNYSPQTSVLTKTVGASVQVLDQSNQSNLNLFTAVHVASLNPETFTVDAYNQPKLVTSSFGNSNFSLVVQADYVNNRDYSEIVTNTPFGLDGINTNYKRMRFEFDYASRQVNIFVSDFIYAYLDTTNNIIKDPDNEQIETLAQEYRDYCAARPNESCSTTIVRYFDDTNYRRTAEGNEQAGGPTPAYTYTGSFVSWR